MLPYPPRAATGLVGSPGNSPSTRLMFTGFNPGAPDAQYGAATSYTVKVTRSTS
jgi:hypothetical protein